MSLTLFPITALLLLLSGVGSPMPASGVVEARAALLRELFGNYDAAHGDSAWSPAFVPPRYADYFEDGKGYAAPLFQADFTDQGSPRHLLVLGTNAVHGGYGCHACDELISAIIFSPGPQHTWTVQQRKDFLAVGGESGYSPDFRLKHLGANHVALELDNNHCGPGDCYSTESFFAITPPRFQLLLAVRRDYEPSDLAACLSIKHYVESDDCGQAHMDSMCFPHVSRRDPVNREYCTYWTSTLQAMPPARPGTWSDLLYTQTVKLASPGAFTHKQYRTRFGFSDGAYEAVGPPAHGPRPDLDFYKQ